MVDSVLGWFSPGLFQAINGSPPSMDYSYPSSHWTERSQTGTCHSQIIIHADPHEDGDNFEDNPNDDDL